MITPLDMVRPGASLTLNPDGSAELSVINYDTERGPFWYVEIDGTPLSPDRPLPLEHAIAVFRREVATADPGDEIGLRQCTAEDLEWAGVPTADDDDD